MSGSEIASIIAAGGFVFAGALPCSSYFEAGKASR